MKNNIEILVKKKNIGSGKNRVKKWKKLEIVEKICSEKNIDSGKKQRLWKTIHRL